MSNFQHAFDESMCEYAIIIQRFIDKGWRIISVEYGEQKYGISTSLFVERNGERQKMQHGEIEDWLNKEYEREFAEKRGYKI